MDLPVTPESAWQPLLRALPAWEPPPLPTVVLAPHPDDETLAAGGLIASLCAAGTPVSVIAATDGEAAYKDAPGLAATRVGEQTAALARLGVGADRIHRLALPDSGLARVEDRILDALLAILRPGMHLLAPWAHDFHPDHEACGRAALRAARALHLRLTCWFFWTWHRGTPDLLDGLPLVRLPLAEDALQARWDALACHASQLEGERADPILPPVFLAPLHRPFEVFLPA